MTPRKVDWVVPDWNKETELPDEIKKVMYDLYIQNGSSDVYSYDAFFDLDLKDVISALEIQNKRIDVKLIVDSDNYYQIENISVEVKQDFRSPFMHNKFCIIDGVKFSSGSLNPTDNGAYENNNNLLFGYSKTLALNYEDEFHEMWNGVFGKGANVENPIVYLEGIKVENYFCPEDDCADKVIRTLKKAESSIYFMTFSFTHGGIGNVLLMKNLEGVLVKGVFENRGSGSEYSKFNIFDFQGISVVKDKNPANMHHKVFIIDNSIVITGSFNPSANADERNDENILIIYDKELANEYIEEFKRLSS